MTKEQKMAKDNMIFLFKTGSHLYGTNTPKSDEDYEGIFIEPPEYILGTKNIREVDLSTNKTNIRNTKKDVDYKLYSLRTFFKLAADANPNKIEYFFVPEKNKMFETSIWFDIECNKHLFISKKLLHSFSGYAMSQRKKLSGKKKRYEELVKFQVVLEAEILNGAQIIGDLDIYEIRKKKKYKDEIDQVVELTHVVIKGNYEWIKYYQDQGGADCIRIGGKIYNYGMDVQTILENVTNEVNKYGHRTTHLEQYGYDVKFAYHLFRLFDEAKELLQTGELKFPCERAEFFKNIREGKYTLEELLDLSKDLDDEIQEIAKSSSIPHKPDFKAIDKLQQEIYLKYWKKYKLI